MHDAIKRAYKLARQHCKTPMWGKLGLCELAIHPLVKDCQLVEGQKHGESVLTLLEWIAETLKPNGLPAWGEYRWRYYLILTHYYLRGGTLAEMTERMGIGDPAFYKSVRKALEAAMVVLEQGGAGQQVVAVARRMRRLTEGQQETLLRLAVFEDVLVLPSWAREDWMGIAAAELAWELDGYVVVRAGIKDSAETQHQLFAAHYLIEIGAYVAAAKHLLRADQHENAAQLLLKHQATLRTQDQIQELNNVVAQISQLQLQPLVQAQFALLRGHIAAWLTDLESAKRAYQWALSTTDIPIRAQAYFFLADLLSRSDIDAALIHFERCIEWLTDYPDWQHLVAECYLHRARIFLQERHDATQAKYDLTRAQVILDQQPSQSALRSDMHKTWTMFYRYHEDREKVQRHAWLAWQTAHEAQSAERIMDTAHNLGVAYAEAQQFEQALTYLLEGYERSSAHRQKMGMNAKHIGACYYELGQPLQAIQFYEEAYQCFIEAGLKVYQAYVGYDLAEVLVQQGKNESAYHYFCESMQLNQVLKIALLENLLTDLQIKWVEFSAELTPRHRKILAYVRQHGSITKQQCKSLINLKDRQATRILKDELDRRFNILQTIGRGRSSRYILASIDSSRL